MDLRQVASPVRMVGRSNVDGSIRGDKDYPWPIRLVILP